MQAWRHGRRRRAVDVVVEARPLSRRATYRVQLHPGFGFRDAAALADYLAELGVSHLYLSPVAEAVEGSTHGYDVVDPTRLRSELGGPEGFTALVDAAGQAGLAVLVDIVPNHLATDPANRWWWQALADGADSDGGRTFDIDWTEGAVVLPVLADGLDPAEVAARYPTGGHWRLIHWRDAGTQINYRRFFAINELAGVRVEDPAVFTATHPLVLDLVTSGRVDGVRIDHIDGLREPGEYLERLRREVGVDPWIVVEKILEADERVPSRWPVDGTTGYEFAARVDRLQVDPAGEAPLTRLYQDLTGESRSWAEVVRAAKAEVIQDLFPADLQRVAREAGLSHEAVYEQLLDLDRYRTYDGRPSPRFEQLSGAVMAKGVEDTAMYRYVRLLSLNEVGSDPSRFGAPADELHDANAHVQASHPTTLLAASTHDTKRSEDVRARLHVLAEAAPRWTDAMDRWFGKGPDPATEYLFWQTLVGAHPIDGDRLQAYLTKAAREAAVHTTWFDPDPEFETALDRLVTDTLADEALMAEVGAFVAHIDQAGRTNSLAQTALRLTSPGVPDVYQGTELWRYDLVDPDNRRPVDYDRRRRLLGGGPPDGEAKLALIHRVLRFRADRPEPFGAESTYEPLFAEGPAADHVVAFARAGAVVTVVPRFPRRLGGDWAGTTIGLPPGPWRDVVTGASVTDRQVAVEQLLAGFPVAVLTR